MGHVKTDEGLVVQQQQFSLSLEAKACSIEELKGENTRLKHHEQCWQGCVPKQNHRPEKFLGLLILQDVQGLNATAG